MAGKDCEVHLESGGPDEMPPVRPPPLFSPTGGVSPPADRVFALLPNWYAVARVYNSAVQSVVCLQCLARLVDVAPCCIVLEGQGDTPG